MEARLRSLREEFKSSLACIETDFKEQLDWMLSVHEGLRNGSIGPQSIFHSKTPCKVPSSAASIKGDLDNTVVLENEEPVVRRSTRINRTQNQDSLPKNVPKKRTRLGAKNALKVVVEINESVEEISAPCKRLSDETLQSISKRVRVSKVSCDSGLSSAESRDTQYSSVGGVIKQEISSPIEKIANDAASLGLKVHSNDTIRDDINRSSLQTAETNNLKSSCLTRKTSRSAGKVSVEEKTRTSRSKSESKLTDHKQVIVEKIESDTVSNTCLSSNQSETTAKSPALKKSHVVKGDSVMKAVKAFEALNEVHTSEDSREGLMHPPTIPMTKILSSLDDAVNAPTRLTRTKTRALAKAAAEEEKEATSKGNLRTPPILETQKSPIPCKIVNSGDKPFPVSNDKELQASSVASARFLQKPFGSASKSFLFLKTSTPLNRPHLVTPSHPSSSSFSVPRLNNVITSVASFISKPHIPEVRQTREDNIQKLVAKAEFASKKREEILKAQLEEKMKKREEKRMKVCAAREALEKEKFELQQRLEREREEKQRHLQAEREERLRQEALKKKRLAQQKAAETEERRKQEEAARLAKLKQQEEEQKRLAALKKKEQEEAEQRHLERLQQEREAAELRTKEAERLAKELALKAKKKAKPAQLDETYDKLPNTSQSYGLTPAPEDRKPLQPKNPDNYSIDDVGTDDSSEDESKPKKVVPMWAQSKQRMPKLLFDCEVTHHQMSVFFGSTKSTPDLSKIFTSIDRRQLIRKSSAVWRTPPSKFSPGF